MSLTSVTTVPASKGAGLQTISRSCHAQLKSATRRSCVPAGLELLSMRESLPLRSPKHRASNTATASGSTVSRHNEPAQLCGEKPTCRGNFLWLHGWQVSVALSPVVHLLQRLEALQLQAPVHPYTLGATAACHGDRHIGMCWHTKHRSACYKHRHMPSRRWQEAVQMSASGVPV